MRHDAISKPLRHLLLAVAALAIAGCDGKEDAASTPAAPAARVVIQPSAAEQAAAARRQIVRWLECEECTDGELDALKILGQSAVPNLAATLHDGPSPATRERLRLHLGDTYRRTREYASTHPDAKFVISEADFVRAHLDSQDARYRARSAQALAAIGGNEARKALEDATGYHLRPDVLAEVADALSRFPGP